MKVRPDLPIQLDNGEWTSWQEAVERLVGVVQMDLRDWDQYYRTNLAEVARTTGEHISVIADSRAKELK